MGLGKALNSYNNWVADRYDSMARVSRAQANYYSWEARSSSYERQIARNQYDMGRYTGGNSRMGGAVFIPDGDVGGRSYYAQPTAGMIPGASSRGVYSRTGGAGMGSDNGYDSPVVNIQPQDKYATFIAMVVSAQTNPDRQAGAIEYARAIEYGEQRLAARHGRDEGNIHYPHRTYVYSVPGVGTRFTAYDGNEEYPVDFAAKRIADNIASLQGRPPIYSNQAALAGQDQGQGNGQGGVDTANGRGNGQDGADTGTANGQGGTGTGATPPAATPDAPAPAEAAKTLPEGKNKYGAPAFPGTDTANEQVRALQRALVAKHPELKAALATKGHPNGDDGKLGTKTWPALVNYAKELGYTEADLAAIDFTKASDPILANLISGTQKPAAPAAAAAPAAGASAPTTGAPAAGTDLTPAALKPVLERMLQGTANAADITVFENTIKGFMTQMPSEAANANKITANGQIAAEELAIYQGLIAKTGIDLSKVGVQNVQQIDTMQELSKAMTAAFQKKAADNQRNP